jgi:glycosylphosphatidylinositol transamidase (GPIT) subunit GPI8
MLVLVTYVYHNAWFKTLKLSYLFGLSYSQIILMVTDDTASIPRNPHPLTVFTNANQHIKCVRR